MRHHTYLMCDTPNFGTTYTARCKACDWTAARHPLGDGCALALAHEAHPEARPS